MDIGAFFQQYWPLVAVALWFGYKWWSARQVVAMLPALRQQGAVLVDVRSAAEFAGGNAPGTVNIPLPELSSRPERKCPRPRRWCCAAPAVRAAAWQRCC